MFKMKPLNFGNIFDAWTAGKKKENTEESMVGDVDQTFEKHVEEIHDHLQTGKLSQFTNSLKNFVKSVNNEKEVSVKDIIGDKKENDTQNQIVEQKLSSKDNFLSLVQRGALLDQLMEKTNKSGRNIIQEASLRIYEKQDDQFLISILLDVPNVLKYLYVPDKDGWFPLFHILTHFSPEFCQLDTQGSED